MTEEETLHEVPETDGNEKEDKTFDRPAYAEEIASIVKATDSFKELKERLSDYHENDIADALPLLTQTERVKLYRSIGMEQTSEIFTYLDDVSTYLEEIDAEKAADIVESMDADDAVDVLEELNEDKRRELEGLLEEDAMKDIALINSYTDDEIGSKMTTNFVVMNKGLTIAQAMKSLVKQAADNDNISTIYTVNDDGTFYGAIELTDLIRARKEDDLEELITTSYPFVYAKETVDETFEDLKDYSEDSIPVLDPDKRILGVITTQDILEVADEEMGEDYAKLGGLLAEEDLKEPLRDSMKKRIPWLVILLFLGLLVSSVVGVFEGVVATLPIIICFQSMILDMSGNAGTQSLAVTIRVLSDEELTAKQKFGLVGKEIRVGLVNGLLIGSIAFLVSGIYILVAKGGSLPFAAAVAFCIAIALVLSMLIASFTGTAIPLFFKKLGVDPAVASGPLITTINDLVAVVMYYGLARLLLINVMGL
ncbi:MAG: magnesium transporter [Lachnospiraceae bacterium]|nr:magnesium transporter [Lachnospiraceae bacterium]